MALKSLSLSKTFLEAIGDIIRGGHGEGDVVVKARGSDSEDNSPSCASLDLGNPQCTDSLPRCLPLCALRASSPADSEKGSRHKKARWRRDMLSLQQLRCSIIHNIPAVPLSYQFRRFLSTARYDPSKVRNLAVVAHIGKYPNHFFCKP